MGIDAVAYFVDWDFFANPMVTDRYLRMMSQREIQSVLFLTKKKDKFQISILEYNPGQNLVFANKTAWKSSIGSIHDVFLALGLNLSKVVTPSDRTNFLVPENAQVYQYIPLSEGIILYTYPSQLKRVKLAVERFEKVEIPNGCSNQVRSKLEAYNSEIDIKNNSLLNQLTHEYPYEFELVPVREDNEHYRNGFQYVLRFITTTGFSSKRLLKMTIDENETDYISVKPGNGNGGTDLLTIPVEAIVSKFYVKQTVAKDIYVGKHWDADYTWKESLTNFIFNLKNQLQ